MILKPDIRAKDGLIDGVFDLCVDILMWGAEALGISYNEINVWVFCVIWPLFTLALLVVVVLQRRKISALKRRLSQRSSD